MSNSRHAYLIIAHGNFTQLRKLLGALDDPRNDIFVHVDARAKGFEEAAFAGACTRSALTFIPRIAVHWGGASIIRVELALLEAATRSGHQYYHLLSGMDLPIKSQDTIHEFFAANAGREFIQLWQLKKSTPSRYSYYTLFPEGAGNFMTNLANNVFKGLQMALGIKINRDVDFRYGAQWFSVTHELAKYVLSRRDWLENVFAHTNTCDEIFLPTVLAGTPFMDKLYDPKVYQANEVSMANVRFIDWTRGPSVRHPWVFEAGDYELLAGLPHMFARKFDEAHDSEIIDRILELTCGASSRI